MDRTHTVTSHTHIRTHTLTVHKVLCCGFQSSCFTLTYVHVPTCTFHTEAANFSLKNDCFGRVALCFFAFLLCCCCCLAFSASLRLIVHTYIIHLQPVHQLPASQQEATCQACQVSKATLLCFQCLPTGFPFCDACSSEEHNRDFPPMQRHSPKPVGAVK